jgi:hypothetical protein
MAEIIPFSELAKQVEDLHTVVSQQKALQPNDVKIQSLERGLKIMKNGPAFLTKEVEQPRNENSNIGKVYDPKKKAHVDVSTNTTSEAPKNSNIGKVTKLANDKTAKEQETKKKDNVNGEDLEFINSFKGKEVEELSSNKYSKEALLQILKKIVELKVADVSYNALETKAVLAGKIYEALNPTPEDEKDNVNGEAGSEAGTGGEGENK